jgi:hypothetical protein
VIIAAIAVVGIAALSYNVDTAAEWAGREPHDSTLPPASVGGLRHGQP